MHKTVTITIGGALFHVEENAYKNLDAYLSAVRTHFAKYSDSDEIVSDIEDRVGEEFSAKLKGRKKVIVDEDVEELKKTMGTVEDFRQFETDLPENVKQESFGETISKRGRLYRDGDDQIIAGVCSGLAKWIGIDPTFVRLFFGISIFMGGFGVVLYILLWIILPEAKTTAEKVEMTQGHVTLSAIQDRISDVLPREKQRSMVRKIVAFPFVVIRAILNGIGKLFRVLFPIVGRIGGGLILVAASFGIAFLTFALIISLLHPGRIFGDLPLHEIINRSHYLILGFSAYFLAIIPVLFILMLGASLITMRRQFSTPMVVGLAGAWFVSLLLGGVTAFSVSPTIEAAFEKYEAEHSLMTEKTFNVDDFDALRIGGNANIIITQGEDISVVAAASEEDMAGINLTVSEGTLELDRRFQRRSCFFFCSHQGVTLTITMPELREAAIVGSSRATIKGFEGGDMGLIASGSSQIEAGVSPATLDTHISGASHIEVAGTADILHAELDGAASLGAYGFSVKSAEVQLSGASRAMIDATESLSGILTGASQLYYQKEPATLSVQTSGASHLEQRDEDIEEVW